MTRLHYALLLLFVSGTTLLAGAGYNVQIDLASLNHDRLTITVDVPPVRSDTVVFVFPVTVPGTYESHLWWRLVREFQAFDAQGSPLPVSRSADSQFVIGGATRLARLQYVLDDSFDDMDERVSIFQPTGTSFQGDSVFVFNHGGMIGYVEGYQKLPYSVTVQRPESLYCSTALQVTARRPNSDTYVADSFDELVDGPAIFARPDTASFNVRGCRVDVALIHGRDTLLAPTYAKTLQKVTDAIGVYLPSMPVDRYAFLIYLWDGDTVEVKRTGFSQGALEHSYSSLYFWRFSSRPFGLESVAAHEFLHILVPLNLHSREIDEFNFRDPKMSAHLWLYEGVTEYFSNQALLRGNVVSESRFLREIKQQGKYLSRLPTPFSLCDFSRNVLSDENQQLYPLIYQIGPLNALLMDIHLREDSQGASGLLQLVYQLMDRYGPSRPFDDDDLFTEIESMTSPGFGEYCRRYVAGSEPYPLAEYLPKIGLTYVDSTYVDGLSYGIGFSERTEELKRLILEPEGANPLGVRQGDVLLMVDGEELGAHSNRIMRQLFNPQAEQEITLTIERDGEQVTVSGKPVEVKRVVKDVIGEVKDLSPEQQELRSKVFYGQ